MDHQLVRIGAEFCQFKELHDLPEDPYREGVWVLWRCKCGFELYVPPEVLHAGACDNVN